MTCHVPLKRWYDMRENFGSRQIVGLIRQLICQSSIQISFSISRVSDASLGTSLQVRTFTPMFFCIWDKFSFFSGDNKKSCWKNNKLTGTLTLEPLCGQLYTRTPKRYQGPALLALHEIFLTPKRYQLPKPRYQNWMYIVLSMSFQFLASIRQD